MMRVTALAAAVLLSGCASDWTREDTYMEAAWLAVHTVDTMQTMDIRNHGDIVEVNPLTVRILGENPEPSETVTLFIGYAITHYAISAALPPRWRRWWQGGTTAASAAVVINNHELGLRP